MLDGVVGETMAVPDRPAQTCSRVALRTEIGDVGEGRAGNDKARRQFELTFDAINLTDQAEIVYYKGDDAGRIVSGNSAFGRSYQIGVRVKF